MADKTLTDITQADFDAAEAIIINLVRATYPSLDLRRGTVLRDILIRPAAAMYASNKGNIEDIQQQMSLIALQENEATVEADTVNAILSNFNITRKTGQTASGKVIMYLEADRIYTLGEGTRLRTLEGLVFTLPATVVVRSNPTGGDLPLYPLGDGTYYCILDFIADATGEVYNIRAGTALEADTSIFGLTSAEAYSDFSGGTDGESISSVIARLPVAISYRAFESRYAIEGKLHDYFDTTAVNISALSVQGYGDIAQLRDKHNPMGFAVGSRVDVYARTFTTPYVVTISREGVRTAANTYTIQLDAATAAGMYAIRSVSEVETTIAPTMVSGSIVVAGSYAFTDTRQASNTQQTYHDIDPANSAIETAYSLYQKATLVVTGVPANDATHMFKLELYVAPGLADIQTYFDSFDHRNVESDYLVRCPIICFVNITGRLYYNAQVPVVEGTLKQLLVDYINGKSFTQYLTRSEIVKLLLNNGITRVELDANGLTMQGVLRDASGVYHTLTGDRLDVQTVENGAVLLTAGTVVFGTDPSRLYFELVAE